mmetsp:Transcript_25356/g.45744  ORF Transcript_25356/g.45744 Transcript_25356/m.45744 type:complete len:90 (-) Transcript_25356:310-579(-)
MPRMRLTRGRQEASDIELRASVGKRRREASSGSVVRKRCGKRCRGQDDIDLRTLVKTQGSTGPLVDVSSTVVTVFALVNAPPLCFTKID